MRAASSDRLGVTARDDHRRLDHGPDCSAADRWIVSAGNSETDPATVDAPSVRPSGRLPLANHLTAIGEATVGEHLVIGSITVILTITSRSGDRAAERQGGRSCHRRVDRHPGPSGHLPWNERARNHRTLAWKVPQSARSTADLPSSSSTASRGIVAVKSSEVRCSPFCRSVSTNIGTSISGRVPTIGRRFRLAAMIGTAAGSAANTIVLTKRRPVGGL
jgi:hypothetical protein